MDTCMVPKTPYYKYHNRALPLHTAPCANVTKLLWGISLEMKCQVKRYVYV